VPSREHGASGAGEGRVVERGNLIGDDLPDALAIRPNDGQPPDVVVERMKKWIRVAHKATGKPVAMCLRAAVSLRDVRDRPRKHPPWAGDFRVNCSSVPDGGCSNSDEDQIGSVCDDDRDNDETPDAIDNCSDNIREADDHHNATPPPAIKTSPPSARSARRPPARPRPGRPRGAPSSASG
jgi:hypothetical protein